MEYDFNVKVIDNVLTPQELGMVYDAIREDKTNEYIMDSYSQKITDFPMPKEVEDRIIRVATDVYGYDDLQIKAYQFASYRNYYDSEGMRTVPILSPHWDDAFDTPRLTFDLQVGGNTTWGITVDGHGTYDLENNQAICFGGTHQIHWRPHKIFEDDEFIEMIFVHLDSKKAEEIDRFNPVMAKKEPSIYEAYLAEIDNDPEEFYGPNTKNIVGMTEYTARGSGQVEESDNNGDS